MKKTLAELAAIVDGEVIGDQETVINGLSSINQAQKGDLTFIANPKYVTLIDETKASAIIVNRQLKIKNKNIIRTDNPSLAFAKLASLWDKSDSGREEGVHPRALIHPQAKLGKNVTVGPFAVIEKDSSIGDNVYIYAGVYIGHHARLGNNCLIYPNVVIREHSDLGNNVTIHSGTVIGADGFGYEKENGRHIKVPQIGHVVIEDDVEIGANVTIDRARFEKTVIGKGTKIDNLVQIAHNVIIGENCILISQVGISGSTVIERDSTLAGQAGVAGHLTIGAGSVVAAQAAVMKSIPPKSFVSGSPARPHLKDKRAQASLLRLPDHIKLLQDLKTRLEKIEKKLKK